jgi:predicted GNAT family acetyltransferase
MLGELRGGDLGEAAKLLAGEGWTFTPRELGRLLATGPGLSVAAREAGVLAGLLTVTRHGPLAWIGNVAVRPELRGRGLGARMVAEALQRCEGAGVGTVKLCSVPKAVSLYERAGFRAEGAMRTFATHHARPAHRPREAELLFPDDLPAMLAMDRARFGGDRAALLGQLLRDYPDTGVAVREQGRLRGFAFLKPGSEGSELGPVVLDEPDPALAGLLLDGALGFRLQGGAASLECTTSAANPFLPDLLRGRGFAERARSTLMARGAPLPQDWLRCAALGGLEKG